MSRILPIAIEKYLDRRFSHLIVRVDRPDLPGRMREYLEQRGVTVVRQTTFSDESNEGWAVFSMQGESTSPLVLELIEYGFPQSIRGIDAQNLQPEDPTGTPSGPAGKGGPQSF